MFIPGYHMFNRGTASVSCNYKAILCGGYGLFDQMETTNNCQAKGILGVVGVGSCKA